MKPLHVIVLIWRTQQNSSKFLELLTALVALRFNSHKLIILHLAGEEGFEPPVVEPESTALPLGHSP